MKKRLNPDENILKRFRGLLYVVHKVLQTR